MLRFPRVALLAARSAAQQAEALWLPAFVRAVYRANFAVVEHCLREAGVFGAPSFTVEGELFWGNVRLEQALHQTLHQAQDSAAGRPAPPD